LAVIDEWGSDVVNARLAAIADDPQPSGWTFERGACDPADSDWIPTAFFAFVDGDYLVWGGYWIGPVDPQRAELWWIDRILQPIARPSWF
jgi:hypothetical protein